MTQKLLFADDFLDVLQFTRTLYITARTGGGKTHLAVTLAAWLLGSGLVDKVVSNIDCVFSELVQVPLKRAAIVLDESWIYLMNRNDIFMYAGFVRKHDHFLLLPSVYPVHRLAMRFMCWRWYNLFTLGIHGWVYKWRNDRETEHDTGYFVLLNPEDGFGYYDSKAVPKDDGGIMDAVERTSGSIWEKRASRGVQENDEEVEAVVSDAVESMDELSREVRDSIKKIAKKSRRR